ncbi:metallophosphoesterase [Methylorubrum extorquens]|uniref:metallophosphoesterase n=1 Tax=Methylorubrum extorquens TaxID=408 RepID=UPI00209FC1E6|nr:metallophosphoesterase [Methylorubrum extorquens]MCP1539785.1 calcineurin-like phosphoesterase family protein [Methylorubrum extorquens]
MPAYFTADCHFGSEGVLAHCGRPFRSGEEHDRGLIDRWNNRVGDGDDVFVLGDFALGATARELRRIFGELRGRKHLCPGNHDNRKVLDLPWASTLREILRVTVERVPLFLSHYPCRSWAGMWGGTIHLHGHTHGSIPDTRHSCDVGVDRWQLRPVTLREILDHLAATQGPLEEELARADERQLRRLAA